jgi:hypothetical protein
MQYAVYLPNSGLFGDRRTLAAPDADAERVNWEGFFIRDHIAAHGGTQGDEWLLEALRGRIL